MSDPIILPGRRGFHIAAPASCFEEDKEIAWEAAKARIVPRPDIGWIISNYVNLSAPGDPHPNDNGHIFTLADGEAGYRMVVDTPLNWLHHDQFIVGHYVEAEIMYHVGPDAPVADASGSAAHVETLATFYRSVYPKHWAKVKDAHAAGMLHASMEAIPVSVTCAKAGCCGETFPFAGVWSPTYCDSMQKPDREFVLNQPLFIGGACVVPPHRPGWRDASAIEVATYIETHQEEAGRLYQQIAATHEGLDDAQCEAILAALLAAADAGDGDGGSRISMHTATGSNAASVTLTLADAAIDTTNVSWTITGGGVGPLSPPPIDDQANLQGVIVALVPNDTVAAALADLGTEPLDQLHVTLAFLGDSNGEDAIPGQGGPVTVEQINAAVAVFAAAEQPIQARISGLGRFSIDDGGGSEVTYASVDAPGLNEMRARLVEYLDAVGIPVSHDHGFTPHITLQYHRAGEGPVDLPEPLSWDIDGIELWWGSAMHASHSFAGAMTAEAMAAAVVFEAVASIDDLDGPEGDALRAFVAVASLETLGTLLGVTNDQVASLIAEAVLDRTFSTEERRDLAKKGQAMPDGSFPTPTKADWMNARAAIGRAKPSERAAIISYLKRRAKALRIPTNEIPDAW